MIIKPFKNSHPLVLFTYFMLVLFLAMVQRNYYIIFLIATGAVIMDYYYNSKVFLKDMRYFIILIIIVTITNPLFVTEGFNILYQNNYITITSQALVYGFVFGILLGSMLLWFKVLKACLTDSHIVYLFGSILPTLGLVISMSLNIISKLKRQYQKIKEANVNMPVTNKFSYYRNVVVILITYAFESSLEMMSSMEARGYGQAKRTNFHLYSFRSDDVLKLFVVVILAGICFYGYFRMYRNFYYYPIIQKYSFHWLDGLYMLAYLALMLLPIYLGGKKDVSNK